MAQKTEPVETTESVAAASGSAYSEDMQARVNQQETILRGIDAHGNARGSNIVLHGKRGFADGKRYRVTFTEIPEAEYAPKPTAEEVAAAKATLEAANAK